MAIPEPLYDRLRVLARAPVLLVACDYDGTLSPIVDDPAKARPDREAMVALRNLAEIPNTHVAVISGRGLRDLAELTGAPERVHLVGSHGSEFDPDFAASLPPEASRLRDEIARELEQIAASAPGLAIEKKPASVAFHFRNASEADAEAAVERVCSGPAKRDGVHVKTGKMVIELTVVRTNKGTALNTIRRRLGASAVAFIGDDITDEDAFVTLAGPDLGVKVGQGDTEAAFRVEGTADVSRLLAALSELRDDWLGGSGAVPIEQHSMLTDQRTIAMVAPGARVVWMCAPRIDSPALFAELLGGPSAGHFTVAPAGLDAAQAADQSHQSYAGDDFHLRTSFTGFTVTDYLDCSGGRIMQRAGRSDLVRVIEGEGRVRIEFAPRLDFGRVPTALEVRKEGLVVEDTFDPIVLRAPGVGWRIIREGNHQTAVAEVDLTRDRPLVLELRYGTGSLSPSVAQETQRRAQTEAFWSTWADQLALPSLRPHLVRRSALVLKGLCHGPTGAIAAAATTSLPEWIGGVRNWDYRYCWPRDASMSAASLVRLGSTGEAMRFLDWLLGVLDSLPSPDRLGPIYTVTGHELAPEAEITELAGYAGSRPVRIGNAASRQIQLDVFGPIVELIHLLVETGAPLSAEHWRLAEVMVSAVSEHWREPDHGIWEVRGPRRHHVHSKVMCWQTVRLGVEIADRFAGRARPEWARVRDEIAGDILANGWNPELGAFTAAYGEEAYDAAVLTVGLCGLVDPDDPRFAATVESIERTLRGGPTVYRYRYDDGLPGSEGGFNLCTAWLIQAYAKTGRVDDARELFDALAATAGPTGLVPEEYDPETGLGLGNHPQAYSHLGLIDSALAIEAAS